MSDLRIERQVPEEALPEFPDAFIKAADDAEKRAESYKEVQEARVAESQGRTVAGPERCNEVSFEVGDKKIKMSRPKFPMTMRVNRILNNEQFSDANLLAVTMSQVQALLHVSEVDGEEMSRPSNMIEIEKLIQDLGSEATEGVFGIFQECFPGLTRVEIKNVKKS